MCWSRLTDFETYLIHFVRGCFKALLAEPLPPLKGENKSKEEPQGWSQHWGSPAPPQNWLMAAVALGSRAACERRWPRAGLLLFKACFLCTSAGISCCSSCLLRLWAQAVALLPSWQCAGVTSCAGDVKAILWFFLCSHWEIKARTLGTAKREPNYIYNIKVSAFVVLPFSRVFHK